MIQIYPLFRLQQLDTRIASLERRASADDGSAEIEKKIRIRERKRADADAHRHTLRTHLKDTELRLASLESHIKDIEKKLYAGGTTSAKELGGFAQELELLKTQKGALEESTLALMDQVEAASTEVTALEGRIEKARKELEEQRQKVGSSRHELETQIAELRDKRTGMIADIEATLLARYERLRQRKDGIAVARIESNACGECGASIVDSVKRRVQERQLELCPYCERILFTD